MFLIYEEGSAILYLLQLSEYDIQKDFNVNALHLKAKNLKANDAF